MKWQQVLLLGTVALLGIVIGFGVSELGKPNLAQVRRNAVTQGSLNAVADGSSQAKILRSQAAEVQVKSRAEVRPTTTITTTVTRLGN